MRLLRCLRYATAMLAVVATTVSAQALPPQRVASITSNAHHGGIDGPFMPIAQLGLEAERTDSTGDTLEDQAQQRITSTLGESGALAHRDALTKQQAQARGLGFVATHFEQIDRSGSGRVTLQDVEAYLRDQRRDK
ncbi:MULTISPECIES: 2-oxoglutarate dehydrogenase [Xanthomonas]|uniref:2-oxoglutarate dehydrogenase n=1 Tax=Xanthomonas TaxID=338 RepID=UPI001290595A|nr:MULTISPECIES: 2-oxoglutarate dehydrogenase [Xanthomonas]